jgi:hypothetical protein
MRVKTRAELDKLGDIHNCRIFRIPDAKKEGRGTPLDLKDPLVFNLLVNLRARGLNDLT